MRIAVIGAGPIGLEAAAEATARGHEAVVYEAGRVADHIRQWGHVRLFTPWHMAVTDRGVQTANVTIHEPHAYPTGDDLVQQDRGVRTDEMRAQDRPVARQNAG